MRTGKASLRPGWHPLQHLKGSAALWRTYILALGLIVPWGKAVSQCDSAVAGPEPEVHVPAVISFFAPLFFPKVIADCRSLKEYIRSDDFREVRRRRGDLCAVDDIFGRAKSLSWGNLYEALFISLFATMDHEKVGVRIPLLGPLLWLPLTSEFDQDFADRLRGLPSLLYIDSPGGRAGDRDKLQHFFGSAFMTYLFESKDAADRLGNFIEWGEDRFIVGGVNDPRDVRANRQGEEFGARLLEDGEAQPTEFFEYPYVMQWEPLAQRSCNPLPDSLCVHMEER